MTSTAGDEALDTEHLSDRRFPVAALRYYIYIYIYIYYRCENKLSGLMHAGELPRGMHLNDAVLRLIGSAAGPVDFELVVLAFMTRIAMYLFILSSFHRQQAAAHVRRVQSCWRMNEARLYSLLLCSLAVSIIYFAD